MNFTFYTIRKIITYFTSFFAKSYEYQQINYKSVNNLNSHRENMRFWFYSNNIAYGGFGLKGKL